MKTYHTPVMQAEALYYLKPKPGEYFIDATAGGGGYTLALAEAVGKNGRVIAIDQDKQAISHLKTAINKNQNKNIILIHDNFVHLHDIIEKVLPSGKLGTFSGVVFDLGLSKAQLENPDRGISFQLVDAPLDMQLDDTSGGSNLTAFKIVNHWPAEEIYGILKQFGEEKHAHPIAASIIKARRGKKIHTVGQLVDIIKSAVPSKYRAGRRHFATKVFQALRLAINRELENLDVALPQAIDVLKPGGRVVVISYHSLEDRIVKKFFKTESRDCLCPPKSPLCRCGHKAKLKMISRKAIKPNRGEIRNNVSSRSARLRVAEKI